MTNYDDYLHKLNLIPSQSTHLLRQIRNLDKEVQQKKLKLEVERQNIIGNIKKGQNCRLLENDYRALLELQEQIEARAKEKIHLAMKLYNYIHEPTEKLDRELTIKGFDKCHEDYNPRKKKNKRQNLLQKKFIKNSNQQWQYDPNEPRYCYCERPSYGEMVMCENIYCQREWFHLGCLSEKKLPEKWYCKECREDFGQKGQQKQTKKIKSK